MLPQGLTKAHDRDKQATETNNISKTCSCVRKRLGGDEVDEGVCVLKISSEVRGVCALT